MKVIPKIQDTIVNRGKAEHFLITSKFERFVKRKFKLKSIKVINPLTVVKSYNLKGITFGNYVTQEERYFFLFKIDRQLAYLSKLKGNSNLGHGKLIISFGVEGVAKALAHFNPNKNLINLARGSKSFYKENLKGESSFIHEYGHYIDFRKGRASNLYLNFLSESKKEKNNLYAKVVNHATTDDDYMRNIKNSPYLKRRVEIFARIFESTVTHLAHKEKLKLSNPVFDSDYKERIYLDKTIIFKKRIDKDIIKILKQS